MYFSSDMAILKSQLKQTDENTSFVKQALKVPDLRSIVLLD